jgi:hypothetical protein
MITATNGCCLTLFYFYQHLNLKDMQQKFSSKDITANGK